MFQNMINNLINSGVVGRDNISDIYFPKRKVVPLEHFLYNDDFFEKVDF